MGKGGMRNISGNCVAAPSDLCERHDGEESNCMSMSASTLKDTNALTDENKEGLITAGEVEDPLAKEETLAFGCQDGNLDGQIWVCKEVIYLSLERIRKTHSKKYRKRRTRICND